MSNYYKEKRRALNRADHIINEKLYVENNKISLVQTELDEEPRFNCSFMKVFHKRLSLYIEGDKRIIIEKNQVFLKEE